MFETLDEEMKHDDLTAIGPKENLLKWAIAGLAAFLVVAGLYLVTLA
jgi:hypothetical protein